MTATAQPTGRTLAPTAPPVTTDPLISLKAAALGLPNRPHVNTLRRWGRDGLFGVKLWTKAVGDRVYTTHEAVSHFLADVARVRSRLRGLPAGLLDHMRRGRVRPEGRRRRAQDRADAECRRHEPKRP